MTFGVFLGALLHTVLRYYPLKIGNNPFLNSLQGALVGFPAGVCANCSVPTACGITRGHGRVEIALGFLFSSPNFNPVVMMMTFTALPTRPRRILGGVGAAPLIDGAPGPEGTSHRLMS
jgi:uncharacterized membrane protein YraQ (UPF0718 family)